MDITIETLKKNFELTAQGYVKMLCKMWHLEEHYGYWVGDEIGGVWCYGDTGTALTYEDIRVVVEQDVSYGDFSEYNDYCSWAIEFGQHEPNLSAWLKGCPRHSAETRQRLTKMKEDLDAEINKLRETQL